MCAVHFGRSFIAYKIVWLTLLLRKVSLIPDL